MADLKISQLPAATTPVAGTEVLPIVQSSATRQVSIDNLIAGRTITTNGVQLRENVSAVTAPGATYNLSTGSYTVTDNFEPGGLFYGFSAQYSAGNISSVVNNNASGNDPNVFAGNLTLKAGNSIRTDTGNNWSTNTGGTLYIDGGVAYNSAGSNTRHTFVQGKVIIRTATAASRTDSTLTDRVTIDGTTGNTTLNTGNLVISTSGKGIDFSATGQADGMTSELLADYEEGTWTPTALGATSAGTTTYTAQFGVYTKVGNIVTASFNIGYSATTGTGSLLISLPFTVKTQTGLRAVGTIQTSQFNLSAAAGSLTCFASSGGTALTVYLTSDDAAWAIQDITNETATFIGTITYTAA